MMWPQHDEICLPTATIVHEDRRKGDEWKSEKHCWRPAPAVRQQDADAICINCPSEEASVDVPNGNPSGGVRAVWKDPLVSSRN